jgi:pimeloyl-ACP methyl ester carboxylesterase
VEREVAFESRGVTLRGTILLPARDAGPYPAVVFLHGSGPATREGARDYAEEFARLGVASLFFDKRGSGDSGGSWLTASLDDLTHDALAALRHLEAVEEIDPRRVGFWGVSQAGWVAARAASRSRDVDFLVVVSGGGSSPRESELYSYAQSFERAGLSEAERAEAQEALDAYFHYLATGEGRADLIERLEKAEGSAWSRYAPLGNILPSEENRPNWSWVATYDPRPDIERITVPVLLLFGGLDRSHPTEASVAAWRQGLQRAGNENVSLVTFPRAGHGIRMREGFTGDGRPPFADGYAELQLGWLWLHVLKPGR